MVEQDLMNFVDDVLAPKANRILKDLTAEMVTMRYVRLFYDYADQRLIDLREKQEIRRKAHAALVTQILSISPYYFEKVEWSTEPFQPGNDADIYLKLARNGICADTVNVDDYR